MDCQAKESDYLPKQTHFGTQTFKTLKEVISDSISSWDLKIWDLADVAVPTQSFTKYG